MKRPLLYCPVCKQRHRLATRKPLKGTAKRICDLCLDKIRRSPRPVDGMRRSVSVKR